MTANNITSGWLRSQSGLAMNRLDGQTQRALARPIPDENSQLLDVKKYIRDTDKDITAARTSIDRIWELHGYWNNLIDSIEDLDGHEEEQAFLDDFFGADGERKIETRALAAETSLADLDSRVEDAKELLAQLTPVIQAPIGPQNDNPAAPQAAPDNQAAPQAAPAINQAAPQAAPAINQAAPQAAPAINQAAPQAAPAINPAAPQAAPAINPAAPHAALVNNPAAPQVAPPIAIRQVNIAQMGYQQAPPPQHPQPAAFNENPAVVPIKLPALALPRFSHGAEEFHVFWNRFEVAVHRKNIATVDKLLHLKSCLHGEASRAVANFPDTEDNYTAVIDTLKRKYGDKEILSLTLHRRLRVKLDTSTIKATREMIDDFECICKQLENLGEDTNTKEIETDLYEKLPDWMMKDVMTQRAIAEQWSANTLRRAVETLLKIEENSEMIKRMNLSNDNNRLNRRNPPNQHVANAAPARYNQRCAFCDNNHRSEECQVAATEPERTNIAKEKHLCLRCLKPGHSYRNCDSTTKCSRCQCRHHTAICKGRSRMLPQNQAGQFSAVNATTHDASTFSSNSKSRPGTRDAKTLASRVSDSAHTFYRSRSAVLSMRKGFERTPNDALFFF